MPKRSWTSCRVAEFEGDGVVPFAEQDLLEYLTLARGELLDACVALLEHQQVQVARLRDSNLERPVAVPQCELPPSEN